MSHPATFAIYLKKASKDQMCLIGKRGEYSGTAPFLLSFLKLGSTQVITLYKANKAFKNTKDDKCFRKKKKNIK